MFVDTSASFVLTEDRDPELARQILESVIQVMVDAVHEYDGTVAQILGDGVMALFGAPLSQEDHAVRACYAALQMQKAVAGRDWGSSVSGGIQPQIRIGLNSGEVVISAVSSDLGWDYRAVGATAHMAARMEQIAAPGTIRMTAETARLVEGLVEATSLGQVIVKGVLRPAETFLLNARTNLSRFQATVARGLTPFVGRQVELAQLGNALEGPASLNHAVVAIEGEPGIGKSRLAYEFLGSPALTGFKVLEAAALRARTLRGH